MKVAILGASGIIGTHMRLCVPAGIEPIWVRRQRDPLHLGVDLTDDAARNQFLAIHKPEVIVNLAGESSPDVVEREPGKHEAINVDVPIALAKWCRDKAGRLIQVSSQSVFNGRDVPCAPYGTIHTAANAYGRQKQQAENILYDADWNGAIVRPTFVLGVRPLRFVGRCNPIEQFLDAGIPQRHVDDRFFSVSFARDVAARLWEIVLDKPKSKVIHIGIPVKTSRYDIASRVRDGVERVGSDAFPNIAPRPYDTTYAGEYGPAERRHLTEGLEQCRLDYESRRDLDLGHRARELALFLGKREDDCLAKLQLGFGELHSLVTQDWNRAAPRNDKEILDWYRTTEAYLWELSAYHCDRGFNYTGMCQGIAERLRAEGARRVLCLGDGIGDLTMGLTRAGFQAWYHDLAHSRTADFANFRFWMNEGHYLPTSMTTSWDPMFERSAYDAIVCADFLEHVTSVETWVRAIRAALRPGGLLFSQNAFAIGSGETGSMPMHLSRNDRFEKEWDPLMAQIGMRFESSNWYRRAA